MHLLQKFGTVVKMWEGRMLFLCRLVLKRMCLITCLLASIIDSVST